jgi:hypothetical protein
MGLKARVGRHAKTGMQCQNSVDDQMNVIILLNLIPAADGGAGGGIPVNRVVGGISSQALYDAILRFQKKYFPAQQSGFVEPGGAVYARLLTLVSPAAPAPAEPTGQWGEFGSGSVPRALTKALSDDGYLNQVEVANILYSTLSNGTVSAAELADLQTIADKSRNIMPRSKTMLESFVKAARTNSTLGPYKLSTSRHISVAEIVCNFVKRLGRGRWPKLDRDEIGVGLLMRLAYPGLLRQGEASLCGPAAFLFGLLQDRPGLYAGFAMDMYEKGTALLGGLRVTPGKGVRDYSPPSWKIDPIDWLTMASLRDSENWFCSYDNADKTFQGATTQLEMAWWYNRAGYSDVTEDANLARHQRDTNNMDAASRLYSAGYRVSLLIDGQMIDVDEQGKSGSAFFKDRHWVVLRSKIDRSSGVKMTIFTWGEGNRQVPQKGTLPLSDFLENYYGYVAGKP